MGSYYGSPFSFHNGTTSMRSSSRIALFGLGCLAIAAFSWIVEEVCEDEPKEKEKDSDDKEEEPK